MSFLKPTMLPSLSSKFDERQWVKQIQQILDEEHEQDPEVPVTIFAVPKLLMFTNPDSYIPHQVAIGPYHHLRPELYDMERYKILATKRFQKETHKLKLQHLVDQLMNHELRIRASYHRHLWFECETLAWMMVVDAAFLFEFLQVCCAREGKFLTEVPSRLSHLIHVSGNKTAHNMILRDIVMLENQVPLFVLRMLMEMHFSSQDLADEVLHDMLMGLCEELIPFKMVEKFGREFQVKDYAHFLDFLYQFIVPKHEVYVQIGNMEDEDKDVESQNDSGQLKRSCLRSLLHKPWEFFTKFGKGIQKIVLSKPVEVILSLPWTIFKRIPILNILRDAIEQTFTTITSDDERKDKDLKYGSRNIQCTDGPPLHKEIHIPTVTQLVDVGVEFIPSNDGISSITFDNNTRKFQIPIIILGLNSDVVLRNLVAYEACSVCGPLIFTRYTELMNGIIDTEEDVQILCQRGIIINHLKSEKEVANLWNGMSRSIRLTKVPSLDKVIGDVNKYYNAKWKVKFGKFMKKYVFRSWKILAFLAVILLLSMIALQAFCSIYNCRRIIHINGLGLTNR